MTTAPADRVIDLDVTRAVAMIGVVFMNYHGYLILMGGSVGASNINRFLDPFSGPLATRFAATFVLVAGMGITLMTNRGRITGDRARRSADRWVLFRRGFLLYGTGFVFEWIWSGTILFFYGAMFMVGALLFLLRTRWLVVVGASAAVAAAAIQWWAVEANHSTAWLFAGWYAPGQYRSPRRLVFDTFVNGTHPLLPWLAFLCAGMILGRYLPLSSTNRRSVAIAGVALVATTYAVHFLFEGSTLRTRLFATEPGSRSIVYTLCALGSAVAAFCVIGWIANATSSHPVTKALAAAGRTSLSLYVLHAFVFNAIVNRWHLIRPTGLDVAVVFSVCFWLVAIIAAASWQRRFGIGPAEWVYRKFGGTSTSATTGDEQPYSTSLNVSH
jgi:uncharacterized membrane protein YeiB